MKRLITIILALIMTFFNAPQKSTDKPHVNAAETPQIAITTQVKQVPEESETTAETVFVSDVRKTKTESEIEETAVSEKEATLTKTEESAVKTTENQERPTEECTEITEKTIIIEPEEETVECIDEGDQKLAEYKPQIGGQPNPFENDMPTEIDDRPVEDYVFEGEDRPGEGIHL